MNFLTPLGFLGLIGLAVLLLIYLLKPNYQNKSVSSTFIWKLSLKYRRRKNPISKLRDLLILLCQVLIIASCAFTLAQPVLADEVNVYTGEKIVIIDASASMLTSNNGETRFERAVYEAKQYSENALNNGETLTVILAGKEASYLAYRVSNDNDEKPDVNGIFDSLIASDSLMCTYGTGDIDGAMDLAEAVTLENSDVEIVFYTGTTYLDAGNVKVVNVSDDSEWNVAILDCTATLDDGYYYFDVDMACYGRDVEVNVVFELKGINSDGLTARYSSNVQLSGDRTVKVRFNPANESQNSVPVYSFVSADIYVEVNDSFLYDNRFHLDGGAKQTVKVQYYSSRPNPFFSTMLMSISNAYRDTLDIQITDIPMFGDYETSGFDFYIFEHTMPVKMPDDGIVFLADIDSSYPSGLGITLGSTVSATVGNMFTLTADSEHPVTQYMLTPIMVSKYTRIGDYDNTEYTAVMHCEGDPVLLCKNEPNSKVLIMTFDINQSDMGLSFSFASLMFGIFKYYLPVTTTGYVFDVNEEIVVNARGSSLTVNSDNVVMEPLTIDTFPNTVSFEESGIYNLTQVLISGQTITDTIFVKIPSDESYITKEVVSLKSPVVNNFTDTVLRYDIIYWVLGAIVIVLFAEWFLHSRSGS